METLTVIHNARLAFSGEQQSSAAVWIRNGIIEQVTRNDITEEEKNVKLIDARGQMLIPGMIDLHIHGAAGYDMMDGTEESVQAVSRKCAETGCTSFLATSVSSTIEDLLGMIQGVKAVIGQEVGARIAGLHLEGPYLNPKRKGMQNEAYLRHPNIDEMKSILKEAGHLVKMVTLAPELPNGMELLSFLKQQGIIVSLAHSDATYEEAKLAFEEGASHVTHCFNGMPPIHHRAPGLIVAAFEEPHVSLQTIVDGVHLHPAVVRLMHRIKGPEGMVLITDALQAMGLGDGEYSFGGHVVTVSEGIARLRDGTLASSTVTMNEALRLTTITGIPVTDAVAMAATTPATLLGLDRLGRIDTGYYADLVLLDEDFKVTWTMIRGEIRFSVGEENEG
ncbi:N-acetylglucosamine-6-phosphate deacetylase [Paenibacillus sedimenti]|uniref:N-acetylglucosamine-6-phosphate deacetylase n=1 Tax=Paenibacillus sedimenti TaxID=2770274 RepID=A0A926KSW4_9BACL|nr:N-acetylglucosamine-6-phosphate deacetylase [Paenibacillus sedimenti]MBD0382912.1 N-acetylglucosamine-6-phosphate deacetylase [Paenibacillus sedimenti]